MQQPAPIGNAVVQRRDPEAQARLTVVRAVGGAPGHRLDTRRIGNVTVVSLQGELSERFPGLEIGRRLRGEVLLDLSQVHRITSFGVREWLTMLRELYATRLTLVRCSESFVHQLTMIRSFTGMGRIASFFAPYACPRCGTAFSVLYDAVRDRAAVEARLPVPASCPHCASPALFDEDPTVYLALEHHLVRELDPQMAVAVAQLDQLDGAPIRKAVVGRETWITLNVSIDGSLRLQRALEGIEGHVVFDLSPLTGVTEEGLDRFLGHLRALGPEVTQIGLVACPWSLLERLLSTGEGGRLVDPRIGVASVQVQARCTSTGASRQVLLDLRVPSHVMALRLGESPQVAGDWCPGPIDLGEAIPLLQRALLHMVRPVAPPPPTPRLARQRTVVPSGVSHVSVEAFAPSVSSLGSPPRVTRERRASTTLVPAPVKPSPVAGAMAAAKRPVAMPFPVMLVGAAALVAGVFVGTAGLLGGLLMVAMSGAPLATSVHAPWEGAPAWVDQPFGRTLTGVDLVGMARGVSVEEGLVAARDDMMGTLLTQLGRNVARRGGFELQLPAPTLLGAAERRAAVEAYAGSAGLFAYPSRVDGAVQRSPFGVKVAARYALTDEAWAAASEHYAETEDFRGIRVARTFPTLVPSLGEGADLVIVATRPWMRAARPGDVVVSVAGQPVRDLAAFRAALDHAWEATLPGHWMAIGIRRGSQPRQVEFRKPVPR